MSQTTKWAMAMALKRIMTQKPLSKITIADITEACGINRMTFYYHFQDIFDLIDWICQEEGASLYNNDTMTYPKYYAIGVDDSWSLWPVSGSANSHPIRKQHARQKSCCACCSITFKILDMLLVNRLIHYYQP